MCTRCHQRTEFIEGIGIVQVINEGKMSINILLLEYRRELLEESQWSDTADHGLDVLINCCLNLLHIL